MTSKLVFLKPGREKSVLNRHPWIFSGGVERVEGAPLPGESVRVITSKGDCLGWGAFSPASQIRVRMWSWIESQVIDDHFFYEKMDSAIRQRRQLISLNETNAIRLIYAESDGIPGLIVDCYRETLVVQSLSYGCEYWKARLINLLKECTGIKCIYERSDVDVRRLEGLNEFKGNIGDVESTSPIRIYENGINFDVDIHNGQKTGFYIDQRNNRQKIRAYAYGKNILNCFCYTGGFTIHALAGGAKKVTSIDSSKDALIQGEHHLRLNDLDKDRAEWVEGDVFKLLRLYRDQAKQFDMIILDPPKFAPTTAQVEKAARGYKDINLLAIKLLKPGGILATFSCSGGISSELFQKIIAGAAIDAGADLHIVERLTQGLDHPISTSFPESDYLKGLICYKK